MDFSSKRLVVFGAGYVGGEVARQARERGWQVTALTRNPEKAAALAAHDIQVIVADLATGNWHAQIPGGGDFVLNAVSSGGGGVDGYRHSYVDGMSSILRWSASTGGIGTLVYTSSTSVYPQDGGIDVDETAGHEGVGERGEILLAAENVLRNGAADAGCRRWFVLRLAGLYGPGRHHLLEQVRSGTVSGRGEHRLNLVHRDDVCAAIWAAFAAPAMVGNDVFNLADDHPARKADVIAWLAERLGVAMPAFSGQPAGGRRAVTPDRAILNTKARDVLGWRPRFASFREGYAEILSSSPAQK